MADLRSIVAEALTDSLSASLPSTYVDVADDVLAALADPEHHEALVRWAGDTIGLDALMRALVDAYGPDSIIASMVEVGALEQVQATLADSEPGENGALYRIRGDRG
jgi:hypothetical protein